MYFARVAMKAARTLKQKLRWEHFAFKIKTRLVGPIKSKLGIVPTLKAVAIEINSACNRRCSFCPNSTNRREVAFLKESIYYKIIDDLKDMGFDGKLTFNGYNEPMLDRRLEKFIEYTRKALPGVYIYINTNGDFLTLDRWTKLREAGLDFANISQYDGKINDNVQKILDEIEPSEKPHFGAHIFNEKQINNRAGLVKKEIELKLPLKRYCNRPFTQMVINYKGKVVLCCNDYFSTIEIGDLSVESIQNVWKSKIFKRYRDKLLKGDRASLELCRKCDM